MLAVIRALILSSTLSLVKYRFVDPSDSASVSWFAILETCPVRFAVIVPAAKLPDASLKTRLLAELLAAEATLIVVFPETPSAFVSVIPDDAVTANVLCA